MMLTQNRNQKLKFNLVTAASFVLLLLFSVFSSFAQNAINRSAKNNLRQGNENYLAADYKAAEEKYIMALNESADYFKARYNLANNYFKQKRYKESAESYESLLSQAPNNATKAQLYHNLGNSQLMNKELKKSVESYKQSLRLNPQDKATRYNLAYAMELLKQQQNQNKDNKQDQQKQDQQKQDQQKQDQQKQDQQKQDQQKQDQQKQDQQKQDQQKQEPPKEGSGKMSQKEADQLLKAMADKEKDTKEKVDKQLIKVSSKKVDKDW